MQDTEAKTKHAFEVVQTNFMPEQEEAINRKSVDRQDKITEMTWKRRSAGLWGGGLVGLFWGVVFAATVIGVAALFPVAGAAAIIAAAGKITAAFATAGILSGSVIGAEVGRDAGAVAGGMRESDRSAVARGKSIEPVPEKSPTLGERLNLFRGSKKFINWKTALLCGVIGFGLAHLFLFAAAGGAALGLFSQFAAFSGLGVPALQTIAVTTMTLFGAFFGADVPTMIRNGTDLAGHFLSGKIWESDSSPAPAPAIEKSISPRSAQVQDVVFKNPAVLQGATMSAGPHMQRAAVEQQFKTMTPQPETVLH